MTKKITNGCLKNFLKEGLSQSDIARACNMSRQAVSQRIHYKPKIQKKKELVRKLLKQGCSVQEISKKLKHRDVTSTYTLLRRWGHNIPSERSRKRSSIIFLASKGYNCKEIAKELNMPYQNVYWIARRNNIQIVKHRKMEKISFNKLRRLCFCNSNELTGKLFIIGGVPHEWVGIGMIECGLDPKKKIVKVEEEKR